MNLLVLVSLFCFGFSLLMYIFFGREKKTIVGVQIRPPKDLDILEVSYIYNKKVTIPDIICLLPYFEHKGYIKIEKNLKLIKIKDYNENKGILKFVFESIFKNSNEIMYSDLKNDEVISIDFNIATEAVNQNMDKKIFSPLAGKIKNISKIFNYIGIIVFDIVYSFASGSFNIILMFIFGAFLFRLVGLYIIGSENKNEVAFGESNEIKRGKNRVKNNFLVGLFIMLFVSIIFGMVSFKSYSMFIVYIVGTILFCLSELIRTAIDKRTDYGSKLYNEIESFKNYLNNVDKEQFEELFKKDPNYFHDILPYGFLLGVSAKWGKNVNYYFDGMFDFYNNLYAKQSNSSDLDKNYNKLVKENNRINTIIAQEEEKFNNMLNNNLICFGEPIKPVKATRLINFSIWKLIKVLVNQA